MNYIKAAIAEKHPQLKTARATIIRDFILKCFEKKAPMHISDEVWAELKRMRIKFKKEFMERGLPEHSSARLLFYAEAKLKKLFDGEKIKLHNDLPETRLKDVGDFFKKYEADSRMLKLKEMKNAGSNRSFTSTLPGNIDMRIASHALCFDNPALITTDDHFFVLVEEFDKELGLIIVHDDNAHEVMRTFGWI